jgi:hypothetical protein
MVFAWRKYIETLGGNTVNSTIVTGTGHLQAGEASVRLIHGYGWNPAGPFYPYILTYLAASAGLTPVYNAPPGAAFMAGTAGVFPGRVCDSLSANLEQCVAEVRAGALSQRDAEIGLCRMLAISAHSSIEGAAFMKVKSEPSFQLLRHIRNAVAHGNNLWNFDSRLPDGPLTWRGFSIDAAKGTANPLFGQQCIYGSIYPADLLFLLQDVESVLLKP